MTDQIHAITDTDAVSAFSPETYAALENGDEHSLTRTEVEAHASAFESVDAAVAYLRANGGGWYFDESGDSNWIPAERITDRRNTMTTYIINTESGHLWLIESAEDEEDALEQYYDGGAEPHISIYSEPDEEMADHLREIGQAS